MDVFGDIYTYIYRSVSEEACMTTDNDNTAQKSSPLALARNEYLRNHIVYMYSRPLNKYAVYTRPSKYFSKKRFIGRYNSQDEAFVEVELILAEDDPLAYLKRLIKMRPKMKTRGRSRGNDVKFISSTSNSEPLPSTADFEYLDNNMDNDIM